MTNAMDLEKSQNPIMLALVTVRIFSLVHAFMIRADYYFFFSLLDFAYTIYIAQKYSLFIDATTVWKEVKRLRVDRSIRLGYNAFLVLVSIANMVYLIAIA